MSMMTISFVFTTFEVFPFAVRIAYGFFLSWPFVSSISSFFQCVCVHVCFHMRIINKIKLNKYSGIWTKQKSEIKLNWNTLNRTNALELYWIKLARIKFSIENGIQKSVLWHAIKRLQRLFILFRFWELS